MWKNLSQVALNAVLWELILGIKVASLLQEGQFERAFQLGFEFFPSVPTTCCNCVELLQSVAELFNLVLNRPRNFFYLNLICLLLPLHQLVSGLKLVPGVNATTERFVEANSHLGRDSRSTIHDVRKLLAADAKFVRRFRHT